MAKKSFPYSLQITVPENYSDASLFARDVQEIITQDLQHRDRFGCMIKDCHIKVGSKQHLTKFVEAELLFHNGHFNKCFAALAARKIVEQNNNEANKCTHVLVVGYESFSELLVCDTIDFLRDAQVFTKINYCIYSSKKPSGKHFRYNNPELSKMPAMHNWKDFFTDTLIVFLVPVNTTLTTHDKVAAQFYEDHALNKIKSINIGLIVIGSETENDYWTLAEKDGKTINALRLKPKKQEQLQSLGDSLVWFFVKVETPWANVEECEKCYPDIKGGSLTDEEAIFSVSHESIVPMLQLYELKPITRHDATEEAVRLENLTRVSNLREMLFHKPIIRKGNHHQFYFDTAKYYNFEIDSEKYYTSKPDRDDKITPWLDVTKTKLEEITIKRRAHFFRITEDHDEVQEFDIIVAPRHFSNAQFLLHVNRVAFDGKARIIYFDAATDFRSNISAKYSNLRGFVQNVRQSKQKSLIKFHFVDDTITSGETIHRCMSILQTLTRDDSDDTSCAIDIFTSVIVLFSRLSSSTKSSYVGNAERFFNYVHLSVSPLRSFGDACPLCKVAKNYGILKEKYAATNEVVQFCDEFIGKHSCCNINEHTIEKIEKLEEEHYYRMLYSHVLNELLSGRLFIKFLPYHDKGDMRSCAIDINSKEDIEACISLLYEGEMYKSNGMHFSLEKIKEGCNDIALISITTKVALIKIISRPFFSYQIRFRQAAFKFCINKLDYLLSEIKTRTITNDDRRLGKALTNALADMNANYLLRSKALNGLWRLAKDDDEEFSKVDFFHAIKHVTSLSEDDQKSLLLEHCLVKDTEKGFFTPAKEAIIQHESLSIPFEERVKLYLENTAVLKDGNDDLFHKLFWGDGQVGLKKWPYYLENYRAFFDVNGIPQPDIAEAEHNEENLLYLLNEIHKRDTANPNRTQETTPTFEKMCTGIKKYFLEARNSDGETIFEKATVFFVENSLFPVDQDERNQNESAFDTHWEKYFPYRVNDDHVDELPEHINGINSIMSDLFRHEVVEPIGQTLFLQNGSCDEMVLKICGDKSYNGKRQYVFVYLKCNTSNETDVWKRLFFVRLLLTLRNRIAEEIDRMYIGALIEEEKNS